MKIINFEINKERILHNINTFYFLETIELLLLIAAIIL